MPKKPNGYPLPENPDTPHRLTCIKIPVYDDPEWYSVLWGHLWELSKWWNWERDEEHSGKIAADKFRDWLQTAREQFESNNLCAQVHAYVDLRVGDGGLIPSEYLDIGCGVQETPYDSSGGLCAKGWGHVECTLLGGVDVSGAGVEDFFSPRTITDIEWTTNVSFFPDTAEVFWQLGVFYESGFEYLDEGSVVLTEHGNVVTHWSGFREHVTGLIFNVWAKIPPAPIIYPCVRIIEENYWYDLE